VVSTNLQAFDYDDDPEGYNGEDYPASSKPKFDLYRCATLVMLLIVSVALNIPWSSTSGLNPPALKEYISLFTRLENLDYNGTYFSIAEELTFPSVLGPIDESQPNESFFLDSQDIFIPVWAATLPLEDRSFRLTDTISTVSQVNVREFGMENCRIQLGLPQIAELEPIGNRSKYLPHWRSSLESVEIAVWRLDTDHWIEPRTLSYNERPPRRHIVSNMKLERGSISLSEEFYCKSNEILSFEFVCLTSGCDVEILQDRVETSIGFNLLQKSSMKNYRQI